MRSVIMEEPGKVVVEDCPMPTLLEPTDAVIKLAASCICGSDLWPYRGAQPVDHQQMGHEYIGEVIEVGDDVKRPSSLVTLSLVLSASHAVSVQPARMVTRHGALRPLLQAMVSLVCAQTVPRRNTPVFLSQTALWLRLPHTLPQSRFLI